MIALPKVPVTRPGNDSTYDPLLTLAIDDCVTYHKSHIDRDGLPHCFHSFRVALRQDTKLRMVVALLHDVIEDNAKGDGDTAPMAVRLGKNYPQSVVDKVMRLTRRHGETWDSYINRVLGDDDCIAVKMADIEDNTDVRRTDRKSAERFPMYKNAYEKLSERRYGSPYPFSILHSL